MQMCTFRTQFRSRSFQRLMDKFLGGFRLADRARLHRRRHHIHEGLVSHVKDIEVFLLQVGRSSNTVSLKKSHISCRGLSASGHLASALDISAGERTIEAVRKFRELRNNQKL
jgi:hypothetical protein